MCAEKNSGGGEHIEKREMKWTYEVRKEGRDISMATKKEKGWEVGEGVGVGGLGATGGPVT